jgi:outer membrane receptor protein involved in Fe transport
MVPAATSILAVITQRGVSKPRSRLDVYRLPVQLLAAYNLFAANATIRFKDKYRVSFGIENLLERGAAEYLRHLQPDAGSDGRGGRISSGRLRCTSRTAPTYDPLGRTYFISMTMDF